MNGNITKEGIKLDLEWMKRVGIGGFQNFDAALHTPQIVEKRLVYMTPEWREAFRYAVTLADQLGLEMTIAGSPGWSESGGPWVKPELKYVWSETVAEGGRPFTGTLPKPPSSPGVYQNLGPGGGRAGAPPIPEFYSDFAVVAFRAPAAERSMAELRPKVTSSGGSFALSALTDGDLVQSTLLPAAPVGEKAWIQFEFDAPQTFRGLTLVTGGGAGRGGAVTGPELEVSNDGASFRTVAVVASGARTISFPPATGRFFRVSFRTPEPAPARAGSGFGGVAPPAGAGRGTQQAGPTGAQIAELVLHSSAMVNRFQDKAGFSSAANLYAVETPEAEKTAVVARTDVMDLTSRMRPDGSLDWTPPPGRWIILRMGYSLTGRVNHPASPEATGLEVDKLSARHIRAYPDHYLGLYRETLGNLMGKRGLGYVITDSWEAGVQNWTDEMMAEFQKRRGYDMRPWLPVLAGRVVDSAQASEHFLWDFRKTIAELTAEYHYDLLTEILRQRGMGRYTESHENGRAFIGDGMDVKRTAAIPMSAIWTGRGGPSVEQASYNADIRESASVAHIYGQNLVAAESLTAGSGAYSFSPETLKPTADAALANGLNRFVIHTSVHQPVTERMPGLSLGPFGQWFTRLETWAEYAKPWITYLSRSSYMLQQGRFVADVLYYYGEDSNVTALFGNQPPPIPQGFGYDFASSDVILNRLAATGGRLTTPSGMSYRLLVLDPNARKMPLAVLRRLRDLVNAGASVAGPKPTDSPNLSDDQAEFKAIADQMWGTADGERVFGKGRLFAGWSTAQALAALKVEPDFTYSKPNPNTYLVYVHRTLPGAEIYWVNNRQSRGEAVEASFRVQGRGAEIWRPDSGSIEPAGYRTEGARTVVRLELEPKDALFVVFRRTGAAWRTLPARKFEVIDVIGDAWEVAFQPDRGAPPQIRLEKLISWSEHSDPGVKYFSGTATYTKTIDAPKEWFQRGARLWLDLGSVKNLAEVTLNGKPLNIVSKPPFRVGVTEALKPGANRLEVKVTNLWVNRIIGDQQPGVTRKYTFTSQQFYNANSPLLSSGLLGPVQFLREVQSP
ncbi:MAG: glycosyl hydrolase [Bryobacteraceae bacterium]